MNYKETMDFLDMTRVKGSILGMESIMRLCEELSHPEDYGKVIHIAGTNGKGSTGAFIEHALCSLGYKVGRFTSPAVFEYEEMWKVNEVPISKERLAELMTEVKEAYDRIIAKGFPGPTVFEVETAAAYLYMKEEGCDYSLIEVGCGGLTDATNVVKKPLLSVITSISMDHMAFLGDTLSEIASMKAGIIKDFSPVVALLQKEEVNHVIEAAAKAHNSKLTYADAGKAEILNITPYGMEVSYDGVDNNLKLTGLCQKENYCLAVEALKLILGVDKLTEGTFTALGQTKWPGRFEVIADKPLTIIDGCHNEDAAVKLGKTVKSTLDGYKIHAVVGILKDKEVEKIVAEVLPYCETCVCVTPPVDRGLSKEELAKVCEKYCKSVKMADTMHEAVGKCRTLYIAEDDAVLVFGSLSYLYDTVLTVLT